MATTLGIYWNASEDCFLFDASKLTLSTLLCPTKRSIASDIAKLFDPIGWLSPIVIRSKILLQSLWLLKLDWDDPVNQDVAAAWMEFRAQLTQLETFRIPRWIGTCKNSRWQIQAFCDASERAYAACVYVRVVSEDVITCRLLTAKFKVAPIKTISLPRLELCGAVTLSRLVSNVIGKTETQPESIHCWTDSQIVLAWLQAHPTKWKVFVANRVSEITTSLPSTVWQHVFSADNPADLATRGVVPSLLVDSSFWWHGPHWLTEAEDL